MNLCGIQINGQSVSGFDTSIILPEMRISLDCGQGTVQACQCQTVLITHGHLDHFGGIVRHAYIRHMTSMTPSIFVIPAHLEEAVHEQFAFWAKVQHAQKAEYQVVVARPGETVALGDSRFVRAFPTIHRVPSQGYVIGKRRKRLKPEFLGIDGTRLGEMRRQGILLEDETEVLQVAFTGDTQAKIFDSDMEALQAKVLITECTFLNGDVTIAEAHKKGHVHLDELVEREQRFQANDAILLTHFSHRYNDCDIAATVQNLPATMRAKTHFLPVG